MDVFGEFMNMFKVEFGDEILLMFDDIDGDSSIKGVVLISGKFNLFVVGVDILMLVVCESVEDVIVIVVGG